MAWLAMKTPGSRRRCEDTAGTLVDEGDRPLAPSTGAFMAKMAPRCGGRRTGRRVRCRGVSNTVLHRDGPGQRGAPPAPARGDGRAAARRGAGDVRRHRLRRGERRGHLPPRRVHPRRLLLQLPHQGRALRSAVRAGDRPNFARAEEQLAGLEGEPDPIAAAVERCLGTFRADRTWVLVHTEYALHATRHPDAAAALRRHAELVHHQLTELIRTAGARAGRPCSPSRPTAWPASCSPSTTACVIREVLGGPGPRRRAGPGRLGPRTHRPAPAAALRNRSRHRHRRAVPDRLIRRSVPHELLPRPAGPRLLPPPSGSSPWRGWRSSA